MATNRFTPLATEFLESLQETAVKTLDDWLTANGAPDAACSLPGDIDSLAVYQKLVAQGATEHLDKYCIGDVVAGAVNSIATLGGTFHGPWTYSKPREPLKWELPQLKTLGNEGGPLSESAAYLQSARCAMRKIDAQIDQALASGDQAQIDQARAAYERMCEMADPILV